MRNNQVHRTHSIERTSPKGGPFLGTCRLCGTPNLRAEQAHEDCPNQRGLTSEEVLLATVLGHPATAKFDE